MFWSISSLNSDRIRLLSPYLVESTVQFKFQNIIFF